MNKEVLESLRFPIGRFSPPASIGLKEIKQAIETIESFPGKLKAAVAGMSDEQLDTPYRPDGWTVRQVIHHVADSHINSYVRFRWTLTEDSPKIKAYDEKAWAELPDAKAAPIELSLDLLSALHVRWVIFLKQIPASDWQKHYIHPAGNREVSLAVNVMLYAWHCDHHLGHVNLVK